MLAWNTGYKPIRYAAPSENLAGCSSPSGNGGGCSCGCNGNGNGNGLYSHRSLILALAVGSFFLSLANFLRRS